MKIIPRIGGAWWPACLVLSLLLLLPLGGYAQGTGAGEGQGAGAGGATQQSAGGPEAVVTSDGTIITSPTGEILSAGQVEVVEPPKLPEVIFAKPSYFKVEDRQNDEGGAFSLVWSQSPDDRQGTPVINPDTGEQEIDPETGDPEVITFYDYWPYHAPAKPDGTPGAWENLGPIPTNKSYVWQVKEYFNRAFFLSKTNRGSNEHYAFCESGYPPSGVYSYSINSDPKNPRSLTVEAGVYDARNPDLDYATLPVYADLTPFGGEKVQLDYVPPEDPTASNPWDNSYKAVVDLDTSSLSTTKPYYILFTAPVHGFKKTILEVQPTKDVKDNVSVKGTGGEQPVPDNRDKHFFRLYVAPAGYELPEGMELPPNEWMIGSQVGPVVAKSNWWNGARTNSWIWGIFISAAVMIYIWRARGGASLFVRRIAGLDHVDEAIGRATEMGRPILYVTGIGVMSDIATIASVNILGQVGRKVADYESRLLVPSYDPIVMAVCQETLQESYIDAGRPDAFNKDDVFFLTSDQFAYAAAVDGIMVREKPATNFLIGVFYAESLLIAETGSSTGAIQIAGTDQMAQLPFLVTACDYTLIGEELYAASAYLSREPLLLGSLKGQDFSKAVLMLLTLIGTILIFFSDKVHVLEFVKHLFQTF
jgi:hypothetical protein